MKKKLYKLFFLFISILSLNNSSAQKVTISIEERDSLIKQLEIMVYDDQVYRLQIMYGTAEMTEIAKFIKSKDQIKRIIAVKKNDVGFSKEIKDSLGILQQKNDSINLIKLVTIIEKYGFLSKQLLGNAKINYLWIEGKPAEKVLPSITIHLCSEKEFNQLLPLFKKEVELGNFPPLNYAQWYDRCMQTQNKKQLYGEYISNPCVENLEITNQEREKIGLKKLKKNNCTNPINH